MALINFTYFLILLSEMSKIDKNILIENKNELLKYLSDLGDSRKFDAKECFRAINDIEESYFIKINLVDIKKQKQFCKDIFTILKYHWNDFNSCWC